MKKTRQMTLHNDLMNLAAAVGQSLPVAYIDFLDSLQARPTCGEGYGVILVYDGRQWRPHTKERLAETMPHLRRETAFPYAHELIRHTEMLRRADVIHSGEASAVLIEQGFTLERLARGFCIGDDGNGEPLFVDSDTGGVFAFYQDGMDVEQWSASLVELLDGSRDWLGDEDDDLAS